MDLPEELDLTTICRMCTSSLLDQECYLIDNELEELVNVLTSINFSHIENKENLRMCVNCYDCLKSFSAFRTNCITIHEKLVKLDLSDKTENEIIYGESGAYVIEEITENNYGEMIEFTAETDEEVLSDNAEYIDKNDEEIYYAVEKITDDETADVSNEPSKKAQPRKLDTAADKGREIYQKLLQKCTICCKMVEKNRMEGHLNKHNNIRPYSCSECSKDFYCKQLLRLHKTSIHTNIKVKCELCDKLFPSARALYAHNLRHRNENRYVCSLCDKKFNNSNSLKRHMAIHSGVREFICTICGVGFYRKFNLMVHVKNVHHQTKEFTCTYDGCKKSFGYARLLKDHIKKNHKNVILDNPEF